MSENIKKDTVVLAAGDVAYGLEEAAVPIQELIDLLQGALSEGATHVVQSSGNYRGAQWMHTAREYDWAEEQDD